MNIYHRLTYYFIVASLLIMTGCTGRKSDKIKLEVTYWGNPVELKTKTKIISRFEDKHPDIKIIKKIIPYNQYYTVLQTRFAGGTAPDIILIDDNFYREFVKKDVMRKLDPIISRDKNFNMQNIYPRLINEFRYQDDLYALPNQFYTFVIYYNKELFDKASVAYPKSDWTWNEAIKTAQKLTKREGLKKQFGFTSFFSFKNMYNAFNVKLFNKTGTKTTINSKAGQRLVKFLVDIEEKYKIRPTEAEAENQNIQEMFLSGNAAMSPFGQWVVAEMSDSSLNLGVVPMPKVGNHRGTQLGIHGFTISKNCENPEAAWSFLKFTTSEEIQTLIGAIQINLPVNPAVNKKMLNSDIDAFQKESLRVGVNSLKFAKTLKCKGNISQTEFYDIIKRNIEHCFKNGSGISPEAALSHAAKEINEKL